MMFSGLLLLRYFGLASGRCRETRVLPRRLHNHCCDCVNVNELEGETGNGKCERLLA